MLRDRENADRWLALGSRRWNWKFRKKHFRNPNPELLLHSSYSFWPWLSTSGSRWDLASTLSWKKCEKYKKCFSRNFQFHRQDPKTNQSRLGWSIAITRVVKVDDRLISDIFLKHHGSVILLSGPGQSGIVLVLRGFVVVSGPDFGHLVTV